MPLPNIPVPQFPDVPNVPGVPALARAASTINSVVGTVTKVVADAQSVLQALGSSPGPKWGIFDPSSGQPVLIADTVLSVEYSKDWRSPNYPIEQGSFANYNKVELPFDIRVSFACGGAQSLISTVLSGGAIGAALTGSSPNESIRADFLDDVADAAASLTLVSVVTPEAVYTDCNITHYSYRRRTEQGVKLIIVDVYLLEIRQPTSVQYTSSSGTSSPTIQSTANNNTQTTNQSGATDTSQLSGAQQAPTASDPTGNAQQPDGAPPAQDGTVQTSEPTAQQTSALSSGSQPLTPIYDANGNWAGAGSPGLQTQSFQSGYYVKDASGSLVPYQSGSPLPNPDGTPYVSK